MRTFGIALLGGFLTISCGGGGGSGSAVSSPASEFDAGGSMSGGGGSAEKDAGAPSTTLMLGDGGELQGTKLTQSGTLVMPATSSDAGAPPPSGKVDEPGRRPEDIQTIIGNHRAEARACYDAARKSHPDIEGNMTYEFVVDPKGNVTRVSLVASKSDITEASVNDCISKILKGIKWAEHTRGLETTMHYMFNFKKNTPPPKK